MCPARGHSTCHLARLMEASCPPPVPSLQPQRSHPRQKTRCCVMCGLEQIPYLPPGKMKCPLWSLSISSLSPRARLPGMQAGPQAANASSPTNPSANPDPSWSRQRAGASCSASQHPLAANSTAARSPGSPAGRGECDFSRPSLPSEEERIAAPTAPREPRRRPSCRKSRTPARRHPRMLSQPRGHPVRGSQSSGRGTRT